MLHMLFRMMPAPVKRLLSMSSRQRWHETRASLWVLPAIYIIIASLLSIVSFWIEFSLRPGWTLLSAFTTEYSLTQTMYSTMLSGVLTLNAFTFNSMLMVLTNMSNQFTPRVLINFISNRRTQHAIGIFNLCFFYLLIVFFFLDSSISQYTIFPIAGILMTALSVLNFILFINHATKWMQAPSITTDMKKQSEERILNTLHYDLEKYRADNPNHLRLSYLPQKEQDRAHKVACETSGYLQIIDFGKLIQEAQKDGIVLQLHCHIGDFLLPDLTLFSYWTTEETSVDQVDEQKYRRMLFLGDRQNEIQDLSFGVQKLKDIAVKAVANDEPGTLKDTLYQLIDLLLSIAKVTSFTPYLSDGENTLRIVMKQEYFSDYLYTAFGHISVYVKNDPVLTNMLLETLVLLARSLPEDKKSICWHYGQVVAQSFAEKFAYEFEQRSFYTHLHTLSVEARDPKTFQKLVQEFIEKGTLPASYGEKRGS
ncbi:hypothetical protein MHA01_05830 [Marinococcus halophilus]|uniref:DUF2254 domain-containing protein n=2 Tax=Marinococcus halophilus TaxID=1371 RepID=A0A510Y2X2_MARHA|nr:hypothetical protein MHA01_05830 [Marinococcus halophilus]